MTDRCLLLLARPSDSAIQTLGEQAAHRLAHASIADVSSTAWHYESGRPERASAYAGGRVIPAEHIAAVVCRISAIMPSDLPHVHRDDRAYVAAEMNGFLRAWLAQFTNVRFNEPTWASLAGPGWHALQWTRLVTAMGVPVAPTRLSDVPRVTVTATVVHDDVFGLTDPTLIEYARRIARGVHSRLLSITFVHDRHWAFMSADPCPELDATSAAAIVQRAFAPTVSLLCAS